MTVLFTLQIIITVLLVVTILMQKTSSDGMLTSSSNNSPESFLTGRASGNLLTKTTAILATLFILNSLVLAYKASNSKNANKELIQEIISDKIEEKEEIDPIVPVGE